MKFLIFLYALSSVVYSKLRPEIIVDWENLHLPYFDKCVKETNVDPMIARLMFRQLQFPNEKSFQCYLTCIFKNNQIITPDDQIDYDKLLAVAHVSKELGEKCIKVVENMKEICEIVYVGAKCIIENSYE
ncbi:hypothetical protein RI129_005770 [Pyrocoelia pectoralis]|uniref:Uncharacterized protein n=1 Tax=Pyrocoelia pectoralis TaxID=417401 RepID=A0AAN7V9G9_9COLE